MTTLVDTLNEYITNQLLEEEDNEFTLNHCDHPEVVSFIRTLNYVGIDFIIKHFGEDNFSFDYEDSTVEIMTWPLNYFTIHIQDMNCLICHSPDSTTTGVSTGLDGIIANEKQVARYAVKLSQVIDFINKHYINIIDTLLKQSNTTQESGSYMTMQELQESLIQSAEDDHMQERESGDNYGYPQCCIDSFCDDLSDISKLMSEERGTRKLTGTGYIPCVDCNEKYTVEQLIDNINTNRDSSIEPFHKNI